MIVDDLRQASCYAALHPGLRAGFDLLAAGHWRGQSAGRYPVDGERLSLIISDERGRGRAAARLETHRRYLDIQLVLAGQEEIGWRPAADCSAVDEPYCAERDVAFFADPPTLWLALSAGQFAVFFPADAHAPLAAAGPLRKAIVKVACEWE